MSDRSMLNKGRDVVNRGEHPDYLKMREHLEANEREVERRKALHQPEYSKGWGKGEAGFH